MPETMSNISYSSICAVNFKKFEALSKRAGDAISTLILSKIQFLANKSVIRRKSNIYIARSREEIASWFGLGLRQVDKILKNLVEKGLIEKYRGIHFGITKLFLRPLIEVDVPVNFLLLDALFETTTDIYAALLLSKIAFSNNNSHVLHNGVTWASSTREDLADFAGISMRTLDQKLKDMSKVGLIVKGIFASGRITRCYYHVPRSTINIVSNGFAPRRLPQKPDAPDCKTGFAKTGTPNIESKLYKDEEIIDMPRALPDSPPEIKEIINFSDNVVFTDSQKNYLRKAYSSLLTDRPRLQPYAADLWDQLLYAIERQRVNLTFGHAASRIIKIMRDGNWKTPFGYAKYSDKGKSDADRLAKHYDVHAQRKKAEIDEARGAISDIKPKVSQSYVPRATSSQPTETHTFERISVSSFRSLASKYLENLKTKH